MAGNWTVEDGAVVIEKLIEVFNLQHKKTEFGVKTRYQIWLEGRCVCVSLTSQGEGRNASYVFERFEDGNDTPQTYSDARVLKHLQGYPAAEKLREEFTVTANLLINCSRELVAIIPNSRSDTVRLFAVTGFIVEQTNQFVVNLWVNGTRYPLLSEDATAMGVAFLRGEASYPLFIEFFMERDAIEAIADLRENLQKWSDKHRKYHWVERVRPYREKLHGPDQPNF